MDVTETSQSGMLRPESSFLLGCGLLAVVLLALPQPVAPKSKPKPPAIDWIQMRDQHLVYGSDDHGNRIPDFSTAGYAGGGVPIPDVPVRATIDPSPAGDDTPRLQAAIDTLAKQPADANGFRGALLLHAGTYRIAGTILVNATGIVLRGAGTDEHGTILLAQGNPHTVIRVGGTGRWERDGKQHAIVDEYVPIGAYTVTVDDAHDLQAGDRVIVEWAMNAAWIHAVGMDRIPPRKDGRAIRQWEAGMSLHFDRHILSVQGNRIKLDAPLTNAMTRGEGATLWKYKFPGRVAQVGIENLCSDGTALKSLRASAIQIF